MGNVWGVEIWRETYPHRRVSRFQRAALKAGIQNHAATVDLMASLIVGSMVEIPTSAASEERVGSGLLLMVEKVLYAMAFTDPKKDYELI